MLTANEFSTVYDFVKATGENNVRKMMTGPKMTPVHVGFLFKVIRACTPADFGKHGESGSFPRLKLSNDEEKLKETFWKTACDTFIQLGLVADAKEVKVA